MRLICTLPTLERLVEIYGDVKVKQVIERGNKEHEILRSQAKKRTVNRKA